MCGGGGVGGMEIGHYHSVYFQVWRNANETTGSMQVSASIRRNTALCEGIKTVYLLVLFLVHAASMGMRPTSHTHTRTHTHTHTLHSVVL